MKLTNKYMMFATAALLLALFRFRTTSQSNRTNSVTPGGVTLQHKFFLSCAFILAGCASGLLTAGRWGR